MSAADSGDAATPLEFDLIAVRASPERLRDLPASATLIKRSEIDTYLHGDLAQLEFLVPGLLIDPIQGTQGGAMIALRGIGSGTIASSLHPTVGLYLDGVPIGTHTGRLPELFDLEEITVVRGVQGVFQGRNNLGGTIQLKRTRPTGVAGVETHVEADGYHRLSVRTRINFPVVPDTLAAKITINGIGRGGGYMKNCKYEIPADATVKPFYRCRNADENERDYEAFTGTLLWQPSREISALFTAQRERDRSYARSLLNFSRDTDLLCANSDRREFCGATNPSVPQTRDKDIVDRNFSNAADLDGRNQTLQLTWNEGSHDLSVVVGSRYHDEEIYRDLDATSSNFLSSIRAQEYRQATLDARLVSQNSERSRYVVGLSAIRTTYHADQELYYILQQLALAGAITRTVAPDESIFSRSYHRYNATSVFVHLDYLMNERWSGEIGTRFTSDEANVVHQPGGARVAGTLTLPDPVRKEAHWSDYSYHAGLTYRVDASSRIYFLVTQGRQSGGFDERAVSPDSLLSYDPANVKNYEMGLRTQWLNDRMRMNFSAFQSKYRHKLERVPLVVDSGQLEWVTGNYARMNIRGYELELKWLPTENLQMRLAASHINSKYARFIVPSRNTLAQATPFDRIEGTWPRYAPWVTYSLAASYTWPFSDGRVRVDATYRYTGDYTSGLGRVTAGFVETPQDVPAQYVPAAVSPLPIGRVHNQGIWNVSLSYLSSEWSLRLIGRNLNDNRVLQNAAQTASGDFLSTPVDSSVVPLLTTSEYDRPRYVGLELSYSVSR